MKPSDVMKEKDLTFGSLYRTHDSNTYHGASKAKDVRAVCTLGAVRYAWCVGGKTLYLYDWQVNDDKFKEFIDTAKDLLIEKNEIPKAYRLLDSEQALMVWNDRRLPILGVHEAKKKVLELFEEVEKKVGMV